MSSAQQVFEVLKTEHSVVRQALATLAELADEGAGALPLARVRLLMEFVDEFDHHGHGARETALLIEMLHRKSTEADRLLQSLQQVREGCDEELAHAFKLLGAAESGSREARTALADTLPHYRGVMLRLMRAEEELLYELARRLLDADDWTRIASALTDDADEAPPREMPRAALQALATALRGT